MKMKQDDEDQVGRRTRIKLCNNLKESPKPRRSWLEKKQILLAFLVIRRLSSCAYSFNIYTKEVLFEFERLIPGAWPVAREQYGLLFASEAPAMMTTS